MSLAKDVYFAWLRRDDPHSVLRKTAEEERTTFEECILLVAAAAKVVD